MEILIPYSNKSKIERIKIKYDLVPKFCKVCRIQGHDEAECRVIHLELKKKYLIEDDRRIKKKGEY